MSVHEVDIREDLLHFIWKTKRFSFQDLKTTCGQAVTIRNFGIHNNDAGPDFLDGLVRIGQTLWHGHIELHIKASDWNRHRHQHDEAYNNVILHVVYINDCSVFTAGNPERPVPALELYPRISRHVLSRYHQLKNNLDWIPCAPLFTPGPIEGQPAFMNHLMARRMERKSAYVIRLLSKDILDWEHVLFRMICRYIGGQANAAAFTELANRIPIKLLLKQRDHPVQMEALLLGQAGLLHGSDPYMAELKSQFAFLKHKHRLIPMTGRQWRFSRMRPFNFPTIRIAQLASLYLNHNSMFNLLIKAGHKQIFRNKLRVSPSEYWQKHFIPDRPSAKSPNKIGSSTIDILMINAFVPVIFTYGRVTGNAQYITRSMNMLKNIKPEKNKVINRWKQLGYSAGNALESQALLELKSQYCEQHKCLECAIGQKILNA